MSLQMNKNNLSFSISTFSLVLDISFEYKEAAFTWEWQDKWENHMEDTQDLNEQSVSLNFTSVLL